MEVDVGLSKLVAKPGPLLVLQLLQVHQVLPPQLVSPNSLQHLVMLKSITQQFQHMADIKDYVHLSFMQ